MWKVGSQKKINKWRFESPFYPGHKNKDEVLTCTISGPVLILWLLCYWEGFRRCSRTCMNNVLWLISHLFKGETVGSGVNCSKNLPWKSPYSLRWFLTIFMLINVRYKLKIIYNWSTTLILRQDPLKTLPGSSSQSAYMGTFCLSVSFKYYFLGKCFSNEPT